MKKVTFEKYVKKAGPSRTPVLPGDQEAEEGDCEFEVILDNIVGLLK
jgi:hypothetical protein